MSDHSFILKPFAPITNLSNLEITGNITLDNQRLLIRYQILGDISQLEIPQPEKQASRRHELWQTTCFEFFVGAKGALPYWEFNLAPSGDWNVYAFDSYREGMREESRVVVLPFQVEKSGLKLELMVDFDLKLLVESDSDLEVGVTTVVKKKDGDISYWALNHCGLEPDFHLRESFIAL